MSLSPDNIKNTWKGKTNDSTSENTEVWSKFTDLQKKYLKSEISITKCVEDNNPLSLEAELQILRAFNQEQKNLATSYHSQLQEAKVQIESYELRCRTFEDKISFLRTKTDEYEQMLSSLESSPHYTQLQEARTDIEKYEEKVRALEEKMSTFVSNTDDTEKTESHYAQLQEARTNIEKYEEKVRALEEKLSTFISNTDDTEKTESPRDDLQLQEAQSQIEFWNKKCRELDQQILTLQSKVFEYENKAVSNDEKMESSPIKQTTSSESLSNLKLLEAQSQMEISDKKCQVLEEQIVTLKSKIDELYEKNNFLLNENNKIEISPSEQIFDYSELLSSNTELKQRLHELENLYQINEMKLIETTNKCLDLEEQLHSNQIKIDEYEEKILLYLNEITAFRKRIEAYELSADKLNIDKSTFHIQKLEEQLKINEEIRILENIKILEYEEKIQEYEEKITQLNSNFEQLHSNKILEFEEEKKATDILLQEYSDKILTYEKEIERYTNRLNSLKKLESKVIESGNRINSMEMKLKITEKDKYILEINLQEKTTECNECKELLLKQEQLSIENVNKIKIEYENISNSLTNEIESNRLRIDELIKSNESSQGEYILKLKDMELLLLHTNESKDSLECSLHEEISKNNYLTEQLSSITKELSESHIIHNEEIQKLQIELLSIQNLKDDIESSKQILMTSIQDEISKNITLEEQLSTSKSELDASTIRIEELITQMNNIENNLKQCEESKEIVMKSHEIDIQNMKLLEEQLSTSKNELDSSFNRINEFIKSETELMTRINDLDNILRQNEESEKEQIRNIKLLEEQLSTSRKELETALNRIEELIVLEVTNQEVSTRMKETELSFNKIKESKLNVEICFEKEILKNKSLENQISVSTLKINNLEEKITLYETEIESNHLRIDELIKSNESSQGEYILKLKDMELLLLHTNESKDILECSLHEEIIKNNTLTEQLSTSKSELETSTIRIEELITQMNNIEVNLKQCEESKEIVMKSHEIDMQNMKLLEEQLSTSKNLLDSSFNRINEFIKSETELMTRINDLDNILRQNEVSKEEQIQNMKLLEEQLSTSRKELETALNRIEEYMKLEEINQEVSTRIKETEELNSIINQSKENLEICFEKEILKNKSLENQISVLTLKINNLEEKITLYEKEIIDELIKSNESSQGEYILKLKDMELLLLHTNESKDSLECSLHEEISKNNTLTEQLSLMTKELSESHIIHNEEIQKLQIELLSIQNLKDDIESSKQILMTSIQDEISKNTTLDEQLSTSTSELDSALNRINELMKSEAELMTRLIDLETILRQNEVSKEELIRNIKLLEEQLSSSRKESKTADILIKETQVLLNKMKVSKENTELCFEKEILKNKTLENQISVSTLKINNLEKKITLYEKEMNEYRIQMENSEFTTNRLNAVQNLLFTSVDERKRLEGQLQEVQEKITNDKTQEVQEKITNDKTQEVQETITNDYSNNSNPNNNTNKSDLISSEIDSEDKLEENKKQDENIENSIIT